MTDPFSILVHDRDDFEARLDEITSCVDARGIAIVRGGQVSRDGLSRLANRLMSRIGEDPFRPSGRDGIQEVNDGGQAIEVHCENGNTPMAPDVLVFGCLVPADRGGETTYCDGVAVWNHMDEASRLLFTSRQLRYRARLPAAAWRRVLGREASTEAVQEFLHAKGMSCRVIERGTIEAEYTCSAMRSWGPSGRPAFVNCLLSTLADRRDHTSRSVDLDDGSPIPDATVEHVRDVVHRLTQEIWWSSGDVAVFDNHRFMHGRRAHRDPRRTILVLMGWR